MLVARSYDDTIEVEVRGARFRIGWVPLSKQRQLNLAAHQASMAAKRRAILRLQGDGVAAADIPARVVDEISSDLEWSTALDALQGGIVAWGVKGHSDFAFANGNPVPFTTEKVQHLGRQYVIASPETLAYYADIPGLVSDLYVEVSKHNGLDEAGKKNSPPPTPPESAPRGDATTASRTPA